VVKLRRRSCANAVVLKSLRHRGGMRQPRTTPAHLTLKPPQLARGAEAKKA
jgi:hypothetical protein